MEITVKQLKGLIKEQLKAAAPQASYTSNARHYYSAGLETAVEAIVCSLVLDHMNMDEFDDWTYDNLVGVLRKGGREAQDAVQSLKDMTPNVDALIDAWFAKEANDVKAEFKNKVDSYMNEFDLKHRNSPTYSERWNKR